MERKSRKLWIMAAIVITTICLAAGMMTAGAEKTALTGSTEPVTGSAEGGLTNEEAEEGYICKAFNIPIRNQLNRKGNTAGSQLSGREAIVYGILKEKIAEVARGDQTNAALSIPLTSIYSENVHYTAEDLGVDIIITSDNKFSQDAVNAFFQQIGTDYSSVFKALLYDCPYELYWFDKSKATGGWSTSGIGYTSDYETIYLNNFETAEIIFYMTVSKDHSASGTTGTYECKETCGQRAAAAAAMAEQIVSSNAGKNDRKRLEAYRDSICELTSYNSNAAANKPPYGDPWQLLYVFDDDPETTVVCEGYSKAFQYLCDKTAWASGLEVISVTGTMSGGTGAGDHMWNIVTTGDGKNYLADVTNSDSGTAGGNGGLFLNGYKTKSNGGKTYKFDAGNQEISFTYDAETIQTYGTSGKLALEGADAPQGLSVAAAAEDPSAPFDTGSITYNARYIANNTDGVTLTAKVHKKDRKEILYSETTGTGTGVFTFTIWEDGEYELDVTATRDDAVLDSCTAGFTVEASNGYHYFELTIPEYWPVPEDGSPYELILNYREDDKPETVDVEIFDTIFNRTVGTWTGISPDQTLEIPIRRGDRFFVSIGSCKTGYTKSDRFAFCSAVIGTLETPTAVILPENPAAGEPVSITINGVENADYYTVSVSRPWGRSRQRLQAGTSLLEKFGLDGGECTIWITAGAEEDYSPSAEAEYTLTVTGERPEAPEVTAPDDPFTAGETYWYGISAEGMTAAAVDEGEDEGLIYQAQNGSALIPITAPGWSSYRAFRGQINGYWSERTDEYRIGGGSDEPEKPETEGPTVTINPTTIRRGENLWVGVSPVDGAAEYAISFGLKDVEQSEEYGFNVTDQIMYDEPFDISDGGVLIQGCNLIQAGIYTITVTAYDEAGEWLCETSVDVTAKENDDLPPAPTVELLTETNLLYGESRFRITTGGGADRVYVFISKKDDYGLEENPIELAIDPEETEYELTWRSLSVGAFEAYFAVSRDGIWSDAPEAVEFDVTAPYGNLAKGKSLHYPAEAVIGDPLIISWDEMNAERFEAEAELNNRKLWEDTWENDPAQGSDSVTIETGEAGHSGPVYFGLWAYAPGYYCGFLYENNEIKLLDPNQKITITEARAEPTGNRVTLTLGNVTANRVRIRIDGRDAGIYGIGPNNGTATLRITVPDRDSAIQAANYDTDPTKWGVWSDPVTAESALPDPAKTLYLPEDLTKIEAGAFEGIDAEAVIIPDSCTEVGAGAFRNCLKLSYVSYKQGTLIDDSAFERTVTDEGYPEILFEIR